MYDAYAGLIRYFLSMGDRIRSHLDGDKRGPQIYSTQRETWHQIIRSCGPMARRLTTNQKIAGSIPAKINIFDLLGFKIPYSYAVFFLLFSLFTSIGYGRACRKKFSPVEEKDVRYPFAPFTELKDGCNISFHKICNTHENFFCTPGLPPRSILP